MGKVTKKPAKIKTKYFIMERSLTREDWSIFTSRTNEFDSIKEAMDDLASFVEEDPEYYCDYEFRIAAVTDEIIKVQTELGWMMTLHKGE